MDVFIIIIVIIILAVLGLRCCTGFSMQWLLYFAEHGP